MEKVSYQAEAIRYYNFPYEAVEEVLSNSVYHKSYELGSPIEVQVWPDKITTDRTETVCRKFRHVLNAFLFVCCQ